MDKAMCGMLSDNDIRRYFGKDIKIYTENKTGEYSFNLDKQLQLASIDLRFRNEGKRFKKGINGNINFDMLKNHEYTTPFDLMNSELLVVQPGEIIFTTTLETINISNQFAGIITGRSSFARMGIMVHCCQEFINPGQGSPIGLQIINMGEYPVELDMRIPICQLVLFKLISPASELYSQKASSKYKNETEFIPSRIYEEASDIPQTVPAKKKLKWKRVVNKLVTLFAPSIILFLLIEPALTETKNMTILAFLKQMAGAPLSIIIIVFCIVLLFFFGKEDGQ